MKAGIYNYSSWIKGADPQELTRRFDRLLRLSGFQIVGFTCHHFEPFGFSAIWLIAESHFALHTWPEEGKSYIELSSCNREKLSRFKKILKIKGEEDTP